jgi:flavin reductase (DIM6/NTAB) family NADH-FMN oxidoreductase RutF
MLYRHQTSLFWFDMAKSMHLGTSLLLHILRADQVDLANKMAGEADQRFEGDHWSAGPDSLPLLNGVSGWLQATVVDVLEVEFSAAVAVRITAGGLGDPGEALVYQDRDYRRATSL